jgi:WD40 repeat protein
VNQNITGITFSPDGTLLAANQDIFKVAVWEVPSGRLRYDQVPSAKLSRFLGKPVFAPDGKTLAVPVLKDGRFTATELLDPVSGRSLGVLQGGGSSIAISADSRLVAAATETGARFWDLPTRKELWASSAPDSPAYDVLAAERLLVTVHDDYTVRLWDAVSYKPIRQYLTNFGTGIALSPDRKLLAASCHDDAIHVWDVRTGAEKYRLAGHGQMGRRRIVAFLPDSQGLLSFGDDLYLREWDMRTGKARLEHRIRPKGLPVPDDDDDEPEDSVQRERLMMLLRGAQAFTPDGKRFLLGTMQGLRIFETRTGQEISSAFPRDIPADIVAFSPDSKLMLARGHGSGPSRGPATCLVDLASGKILQSFSAPMNYPAPKAYAPDGRTFALATRVTPSEIALYEAASGKVRARIQSGNAHPTALAFFPDGRRLACALSDSTLIVWDLASAAHASRGP